MKEEIISGLIDLLNEEKFEDITVKSLCDKCFISRTTFYNYYKSINEVLSELENRVTDDINAIYNEYNYHSILDINEKDPAPIFYEMYKYVYNNKCIFKYIFGDNCPKSYHKKIEGSIKEQMIVLFKQYMSQNQAKEASNITTGFILTSAAALIEDKTALTPKQIATLLKNTICELVKNKDVYFTK